MKLIVGLDPSLNSYGICLPDGTTRAVKGTTKLGDRRLAAIGLAITQIGTADLAVIENAAPGTHRGIDMGLVHGVTRYALMLTNTPYALVNPMHLKMYATGKTTADKSAMALAAYKRVGAEFDTDDECDAWWLRAMGLDGIGQPEFVVPAAHRAALKHNQWN